MTETKSFRVDWYPKDAFIDFSSLEAEEIGVLMQIINLIYNHNGPIENNPKFIGKSCNVRKSRCERIIKTLIQKERIFITNDGKLGQKRCFLELKTIEERRKKYRENGKKGSEARWESKEFQGLKDGQAIDVEIASTSTQPISSKYTYNAQHKMAR